MIKSEENIQKVILYVKQSQNHLSNDLELAQNLDY